MQDRHAGGNATTDVDDCYSVRDTETADVRNHSLNPVSRSKVLYYQKDQGSTY